MMNMTKQEFDKIKERHSKATKGPWDYDYPLLNLKDINRYPPAIFVPNGNAHTLATMNTDNDNWINDLCFMGNAWDDIQKLLAEIEYLQK